MTRKQALAKAIEVLSSTDGNEDAVKLLNDILNEMPMIHWSDLSIRDAVEQFIVDFGRVPTVSDFRRKGMPPHPVIKQKYKITLSEWLRQAYPDERIKEEARRKKCIDDFVNDYYRIKPTSSQHFNAQRSEGTIVWQTAVGYCGVNTWTELQNFLGLPKYEAAPKVRDKANLTVRVTTDMDDEIDRWLNACK